MIIYEQSQKEKLFKNCGFYGDENSTAWNSCCICTYNSSTYWGENNRFFIYSGIDWLIAYLGGTTPNKHAYMSVRAQGYSGCRNAYIHFQEPIFRYSNVFLLNSELTFNAGSDARLINYYLTDGTCNHSLFCVCNTTSYACKENLFICYNENSCCINISKCIYNKCTPGYSLIECGLSLVGWNPKLIKIQFGLYQDGTNGRTSLLQVCINKYYNLSNSITCNEYKKLGVFGL